MTTVKIYSTPTCHFCHMTKDWLKEHNVPFQDINVGADKKAAQEMIEKTGQRGVPVIDIDGQIIIGFDLPAIKQALNMK